jgi:hypothetical protein
MTLFESAQHLFIRKWKPQTNQPHKNYSVVWDFLGVKEQRELTTSEKNL